jgi:hypothetical protein
VEKRKNFFTVKDVLPGVMARLSGDNVRDQINLEKAWHEVAGPEAVGSAFTGFKNGCVYVTVDSPARLYQWKMRKAATMRRLCEKCPGVNNISFKIGTLK